MPYPDPDPTPAVDSYGTADGVAALASTWSDDRAFYDEDLPYVESTNPNLTTVVRWIDQVSAMVNTALAGYGFVTPLTTARSRLVAEQVVEGIVADLAKWVNSKGRFSGEDGVSVWQKVNEDIQIWVKEYAAGIEANGDPRGESNKYRVGSRGLDAAGEEMFPIFQRNGFGNRFENWTKAQ